jgi:hypothetical protein
MWGKATLAMVVSTACMMVASITARVNQPRRTAGVVGGEGVKAVMPKV